MLADELALVRRSLDDWIMLGIFGLPDTDGFD